MTLAHADYQAIASKLKPNGQAFIDGAFCDAADGGKFETTNPQLVRFWRKWRIARPPM